jgi:hypothetical protein
MQGNAMRRVAGAYRWGIGVACAAVCALAAPDASAQRVYKCTSGRTVLYTHEPCVDAQVVDVTPTQGMDKSSGVSRKGADVQRIEHRAILANALQPLTGMDERQFARLSDRQRLDPAARQACDRLDTRLPRQEAEASQPGTEAERQARATQLFDSRQQYRRLRC